MTARLKKSGYGAVVGRAKAGLPNKACGLTAGIVQGDLRMVGKVYLLSDPNQSPEHSSIGPREQLATVRDTHTRGLFPLRNFRSCPSTPLRPSREDIRLVYDPKVNYLIFSLAEEMPALRAFEIAGGAAILQTLEIVP